jgi:hypothetical protein
MYPSDWPKCPSCGAPALDGHITCGSVLCNEGTHRRDIAAHYAGCSCGCDSCNGPILGDPSKAHCGGPNCS